MRRHQRRAPPNSELFNHAGKRGDQLSGIQGLAEIEAGWWLRIGSTSPVPRRARSKLLTMRWSAARSSGVPVPLGPETSFDVYTGTKYRLRIEMTSLFESGPALIPKAPPQQRPGCDVAVVRKHKQGPGMFARQSLSVAANSRLYLVFMATCFMLTGARFRV